jgi:hypothetical protein
MARPPLPQRAVLVVLLAFFLATPAVLIAQPRPRGEERQTGFDAVVSELRVQLWTVLSGLLDKNGCVGDPHGACKAGHAETRSSGDRVRPQTSNFRSGL